VLPAALYEKVVAAIVEGRYEWARERLRDFGIPVLDVGDTEFDRLLRAADTRRGCGRDLQAFIDDAPSGVVERPCPCGMMTITTARGERLETPPTSWWQRVLYSLGLAGGKRWA
jgi:hypothetical protein